MHATVNIKLMQPNSKVVATSLGTVTNRTQLQKPLLTHGRKIHVKRKSNLAKKTLNLLKATLL